MGLLSPGFNFGLVLIILAIAAIPRILYILTLQNTLKAISPPNRAMPPANVWLLMIPLFDMVWSFIVVNKISESILKESKVKQFPLKESNPTNATGIAMSVLMCITIVPILGSLAGLGGFVCWIIYWVQVNNYKLAIMQAPVKYKNDNDSIIFNHL